MKQRVANLNFKEALQQRYPQKSQLVSSLADILCIEKEAVYRRLRGEVPFSFDEVSLVSQTLRISLDQLLGIEMRKQRPLIMHMTDYENPSKEDYRIWEEYRDALQQFAATKTFVTYEAWTTIPFPFCYKYTNLTRFYVLKWAFQVNNHIPLKKFNEIHLSDKFIKLAMECHDIYMQAIVSDFIVTNSIFRDLIRDVNFFYDINCLSKEDYLSIINEMSLCINEWEKLTIAGRYLHTGRKINVYITDINIDTNYTLMQTDEEIFCMLRTFIMNSIGSTDEETYNYIKNCFNSLKRLSTHISVSGEKDRIKYFENEKATIEAMKNKFAK